MLQRATDEELGLESHALVYDDQLSPGDPGGNIVAFLIYSGGGVIVYLHKEGYNLGEILVAGEAYLGQTLKCSRFKVYQCEVVPKEETNTWNELVTDLIKNKDW